MANTVSAAIDGKLTVSETLDLSLNNVTTNPEISHIISGDSETLDADSTPAATVVSSGTLNLSSGSATIDLTAAPGPTVNGTAAPVDFTGLKVNAFKFKANGNNTEVVVIEGHATNGYDLFASLSDGKDQLGPGDWSVSKRVNSNPDVDGSNKVIHFTSSDVDAVVDFVIVGG